jgi:NADPH-dependent 2,4-dienoyl-CoA reductase/sulfur reductase-like enzyme/Fe-S-cluster-containing hydrogenase component 2/CRP-like cAMP-binding protein/pSer/pThr/pTyr-binding forkhead associated (FHA) protein
MATILDVDRMNNQQAYVIIGNGISGVTAAEILRAEDGSCSITIIADDPFPAYYRPALKDYLGGRLPEENLWARPATFYQEQRIQFIPGRVVGINALQHLLQLQNGKQIGYAKLLLANGATPRKLTCPGLNLAGVTTLRTVADYQEILRRLSHVNRVVVCGSGTLALESAETLRHRDYQVTHLMRGETLWSEVLDPIASDLVLHEEGRDGIDVRTGEEIAEIVGKKGRVTGIITTHGEHIPCEMVLIAIGIDPIIDFIHTSGIACGRGVKVDNGMHTNTPDIYAAGDVIETTDEFTGRTRVLGQWFPAIQQAQVAAYNMLGALTPDHPFYPGSTSKLHAAYMNYYNATFLYGLDFVSIGLTTRPRSPAYQEIVADPQPRNYRKVILRNGIIVGALLLGERQQALAFKRAIDHRVNLDDISNQLFSADFNLDAWLDQQRIPEPIMNMRKEGVSKDYSSGKREVINTPSLSGEEYTRNFLPKDVDAFFVPVPHPKVHVSVAETQLNKQQSNVITIGRQYGVSLLLEHSSVSRRHAEITCGNGEYLLRDIGSSNGTFVNGSQVTSNSNYRLHHHDRVRFGDVQFRFELRAVEPVVVGLAHRREVQRPGEEQINFEIDMCIGCNRCMDACPVPISSQVTIADLNSATVSRRVLPHITRFTHECIMCGSCVPVCPVDTHRDLLMLSLKERIGAAWNNAPDMNRVANVLPAGWTIAMLISRIREQAILHDPQQVPDTYLLHIIAASKLRILRPGETVIHEGEYGRDLYLILEGRLELMETDIDNAILPVAILRRGEYVGEDGMLTGHPYKASARAQTPTLLLQVPEQVMQRLMELVPEVRNHFDRFNIARSLKSILKRLALFQGVADADIHALIQQTPVKQYERNERLFAEDNTGRPSRETLHILLEGFVKVSRHTKARTGQQKRDERIIAYRQGGDYFAGGLDLLGDGQAVTVTTINRCRVAEVPRHVLLALFRKYPEMEQRFSMRLREYIETTVATQGYALSTGALQHFAHMASPADLEVQAGLHSLVSDGVVEGTEVLVIDLDKCIHCSECEEACERRHGHSRMNRKGMVIGNISIATACRQCQDPVCMLCSRAGIARNPNGEVYITASCIGCGICAERCPYGAISIVEIEDESIEQSSWQRFSAFFTKGRGKERARKALPVVSVAAAGGNYAAPGPFDASQQHNGFDELRKRVAIKCDLCAGYRDQACVQACPTGAAVRIQPTKFFGTTEEILQRRTRWKERMLALIS